MRSLSIFAASSAAAQNSTPDQRPQPDFKHSSLITTPSGHVSFYDEFAVSDVSPLGVKAGSVSPDEFSNLAQSYLDGTKGHSVNEDEAAYWLKQVVIAGIGQKSARNRAGALSILATMAYPKDQELARQLMEFAGALNDEAALCNLGKLAEIGDDATGPDHDKAIVWYKRAKKAGCAEADAALARLGSK